MDEVGSAWMAAGTTKVMLPSGMQVRWEATSPAELLLRGLLPGYLRSVAEAFIDPDGVKIDEIPPDKQPAWKELISSMIRQSVREVAMRGSDEFQPYLLTPEQVNDDDPRMPRVDLEALQAMAWHWRSPREVDAMSRLAQLEGEYRRAVEDGASDEDLERLDAENRKKAAEFNRIVEKEAVRSISRWGPFRALRASVGGGDQRATVGGQAIEPADHLGPGGRPRNRRRTRAARAGGATPAAAPQ